MISSIEREGNGSRTKREGDATKRVMATELGKRGAMAELRTPRVRSKER
jgi:hypothetical protein